MISKNKILNKLVEHFVADPTSEWVDMTIISDLLHLNVVSEIFEDLEIKARDQKVKSLFTIPEGYEEGYWNLLTPEEAEMLGIKKPKEYTAERVNTWSDLAYLYKNESVINTNILTNKNQTKVISFYSYKGGVGRTTALAHTAYLLAAQGEKVVIVDLDIEAPGFLNIFNRQQFEEPEYGLVDYFYERIVKTESMQKEIEITNIFTELQFPEISGRLFMVPAGKMSIDYIEKSDYMKAKLVIKNQKDYWTEFIDQLSEQLNPDYILVDTRTGINEWGAFSLLMASDHSYFFLYPNEENILGTNTILKAMRKVGYKNYNCIFSKVPASAEGRARMNKYWRKIIESYEDIELALVDEPVSILYSADIAVANEYPTETKDYFTPIVDLVLEEEEEKKIQNILYQLKEEEIQELLEHLKEACLKPYRLPDEFLHATYLEKYFGEEVAIILGTARTGKTSLFNMTTKYMKELRDHDEIIAIDFSDAEEELKERVEGVKERYKRLDPTKYPSLISAKIKEYVIDKLFDYKDDIAIFQTFFSNYFPGYVVNQNVDLDRCFHCLERFLENKGKKLWFLFDNLGEDIQNQLIVTGLLDTIYQQKVLKNIKYKVFLNKFFWWQINYNKERFRGKTIELFWNKADFLHNVLRIISDAKIPTLIKGMIEHDVDLSSSAMTAKDLLGFLWGLRVAQTRHSKKAEDWIFSQLSDSQNSTYPESIKTFICSAVDYQLSMNTKNDHRKSLLSAEAIRYGLYCASKERWEIMKAKYLKLKDIFIYLSTKVNKGNGITIDDIRDDFIDITPKLRTLNMIEPIGQNDLYRNSSGMQLELSRIHQGVFDFAEFGNKSV